jgi:hypothetical protein
MMRLAFTCKGDYRWLILTISASVPVTTKAILSRQSFFRKRYAFLRGLNIEHYGETRVWIAY